jgi:hypothetical protein
MERFESAALRATATSTLKTESADPGRNCRRCEVTLGHPRQLQATGVALVPVVQQTPNAPSAPPMAGKPA